MFVYLNGECWSKPHIILPMQGPGIRACALTEGEFVNVPWTRTNLVPGELYEGLTGNVMGYFSFPRTTLSARCVNVKHIWMTRTNGTMLAFAEGTHARLGEASPVLALARAPELLWMIERLAMM
jgi:hypothetical protein